MGSTHEVMMVKSIAGIQVSNHKVIEGNKDCAYDTKVMKVNVSSPSFNVSVEDRCVMMVAMEAITICCHHDMLPKSKR